jgi:dihydrofolate reductase
MMTDMKAMVVAYGKNQEIGGNNGLLWRMPADLKHYKDLTVGTSIIMGRKTFESIGRPLPDRQNIVISHEPVDVDGVTSVRSLEAAYDAAEHDIRIIGGGTIFEQALPDTDVIYATEVQGTFPEATVFFPPIGPEWKEVSREHHEPDEKNPYAYDFIEYRRS